jgi:tRNA nucleotidyltransferase/poly(A) polymerase
MNYLVMKLHKAIMVPAAGDNAEFLYAAFADVKILQFNSSKMVPNIIRMALSYICQKAKTMVVLVVCFSKRPELRWLRRSPTWI